MKIVGLKFTTLIVGAGGIVSVAVLAAGFYGGYFNNMGIDNKTTDQLNVTKPMNGSEEVSTDDVINMGE